MNQLEISDKMSQRLEVVAKIHRSKANISDSQRAILKIEMDINGENIKLNNYRRQLKEINRILSRFNIEKVEA